MNSIVVPWDDFMRILNFIVAQQILFSNIFLFKYFVG